MFRFCMKIRNIESDERRNFNVLCGLHGFCLFVLLRTISVLGEAMDFNPGVVSEAKEVVTPHNPDMGNKGSQKC